MKIGTLQLMNWDLGREAAEHYREAVEQMVTADQLGFYSCWIVEHHFPNPAVDAPAFSVSADPLTFLGHETKRIKLGTGMMVLQSIQSGQRNARRWSTS